MRTTNRSHRAAPSTLAALTVGCLVALAACGGTTEHGSHSVETAVAEPPLSTSPGRSLPSTTAPDGRSAEVLPPRGTSVPDTSGSPDEVTETIGAPGAHGGIPADVAPLGATAPLPAEASPPFVPTLQPFEAVPMPQPVAIPVPAPSFEPVALADDDPIGVPGDDDLGLAAATGCADHCIADATISSAGGSSSRYDLRVDLDSPADLEAYLSLAPIERNADGRFVRPASTPTADGAGGFGWHTSFDLEPSTGYHLLVRATDEQGTSEVAGSFTTAAAMGPDELVLPMPCADGCLAWVDTDVAYDGTALEVVVEVDADAEVELAWSTEPFGHDADGNPVLSDPSTRVYAAGAGSTLTLELSGLRPNTAHQVLVTATDDLGGTHRLAGSIATPAPPIVAGIDRMHVRGDGDDGRFDRGEIRWTWGTAAGGGTTRWGSRGEAKVASNTTVRPEHSHVNSLFADGAGRYSAIVMFAGERDGSNLWTCFVGIDEPADWRPQQQVERCRNASTTWSSTYVPPMTRLEIEQLPTCDVFGVDRPEADRCAWVHTSHRNPQQVSFDMVVWFDLG